MRKIKRRKPKSSILLLFQDNYGPLFCPFSFILKILLPPPSLIFSLPPFLLPCHFFLLEIIL